MHRIRPHVGLILYVLLGAAVGVGSALIWRYVLAPYRWPQWVLLVISLTTALLVLSALAEAQHRLRRPKHRRAHARPRPDTRKAASS
ncbi:hypothetical protein ADL27_57240 [Streptomyces sp. NRRL F-6602]|nr:hypothetical protein ADL27_57240 [Streptomyces sp. NRRL F-6602]